MTTAECGHGTSPYEHCVMCLQAQLAKAEADAEAHRLRCVSLETQLAEWKRKGLESDRRAKEAEELASSAKIAALLLATGHIDEAGATRIRNWRQGAP